MYKEKSFKTVLYKIICVWIIWGLVLLPIPNISYASIVGIPMDDTTIDADGDGTASLNELNDYTEQQNAQQELSNNYSSPFTDFDADGVDDWEDTTPVGDSDIPNPNYNNIPDLGTEPANFDNTGIGEGTLDDVGGYFNDIGIDMSASVLDCNLGNGTLDVSGVNPSGNIAVTGSFDVDPNNGLVNPVNVNVGITGSTYNVGINLDYTNNEVNAQLENPVNSTVYSPITMDLTEETTIPDILSGLSVEGISSDEDGLNIFAASAEDTSEESQISEGMEGFLKGLTEDGKDIKEDFSSEDFTSDMNDIIGAINDAIDGDKTNVSDVDDSGNKRISIAIDDTLSYEATVQVTKDDTGAETYNLVKHSLSESGLGKDALPAGIPQGWGVEETVGNGALEKRVAVNKGETPEDDKETTTFKWSNFGWSDGIKEEASIKEEANGDLTYISNKDGNTTMYGKTVGDRVLTFDYASSSGTLVNEEGGQTTNLELSGDYIVTENGEKVDLTTLEVGAQADTNPDGMISPEAYEAFSNQLPMIHPNITPSDISKEYIDTNGVVEELDLDEDGEDDEILKVEYGGITLAVDPGTGKILMSEIPKQGEEKQRDVYKWDDTGNTATVERFTVDGEGNSTLNKSYNGTVELDEEGKIKRRIAEQTGTNGMSQKTVQTFDLNNGTKEKTVTLTGYTKSWFTTYIEHTDYTLQEEEQGEVWEKTGLWESYCDGENYDSSDEGIKTTYNFNEEGLATEVIIQDKYNGEEVVCTETIIADGETEINGYMGLYDLNHGETGIQNFVIAKMKERGVEITNEKFQQVLGEIFPEGYTNKVLAVVQLEGERFIHQEDNAGEKVNVSGTAGRHYIDSEGIDINGDGETELSNTVVDQYREAGEGSDMTKGMLAVYSAITIESISTHELAFVFNPNAQQGGGGGTNIGSSSPGGGAQQQDTGEDSRGPNATEGVRKLDLESRRERNDFERQDVDKRLEQAGVSETAREKIASLTKEDSQRMFLLGHGLSGEELNEFFSLETDEQRRAWLKSKGYSDEMIDTVMNLTADYAIKSYMQDEGFSEEEINHFIGLSDEEKRKYLEERGLTGEEIDEILALNGEDAIKYYLENNASEGKYTDAQIALLQDIAKTPSNFRRDVKLLGLTGLGLTEREVELMQRLSDEEVREFLEGKGYDLTDEDLDYYVSLGEEGQRAYLEAKGLNEEEVNEVLALGSDKTAVKEKLASISKFSQEQIDKYFTLNTSTEKEYYLGGLGMGEEEAVEFLDQIPRSEKYAQIEHMVSELGFSRDVANYLIDPHSEEATAYMDDIIAQLKEVFKDDMYDGIEGSGEESAELTYDDIGKIAESLWAEGLPILLGIENSDGENIRITPESSDEVIKDFLIAVLEKAGYSYTDTDSDGNEDVVPEEDLIKEEVVF